MKNLREDYNGRVLYKWFLRKRKAVKRVLMVNPHGYVAYPPPLGKTDTGGQTLYLIQLAKALGKKHIYVDIFTRQFEDLPQEEKVCENVRIIRIPCGPKEFVPKEKMYEYIPEFVKNTLAYIQTTSRLHRYSIVHSHYWDGGYAGVSLARALKVPHVHTPHSLGKMKQVSFSEDQVPVQKLKPAYRYQVRIAAEQRIFHDADAITLLCETTRIRLLERYIVDFEKLHVIYPGIDTAVFNTQKNESDKKIAMQENSILTVSRLVPMKGLDRVIEALHMLPASATYHLYMGSGTDDDLASDEEKQTKIVLDELIKKYHMAKRITFLGKIPHDTILPAYYRNADIFILSGRYEPFGLTTLEAMACGTVPIVSSVAGSREVIVDGLNGYIVDMHDRKALSNKIKQILEDKKLQKKLATNAAFTIQKNYSWDTIVVKFVDLYKSLL